MANGYWRTNGGVITSYTAAQLQAMELAGTLTPYASYVASNIGEEFYAPAADLLIPRNEHVLCSLPGFGGTWDGVADDSDALQAAIDYAESFTPNRNVVLPATVCLASSVFVPTPMHIIGHNYSPGQVNTTIYPHATLSSFSTGFMFNFNTLNGTTAVVAVVQIAREGGMFGVWLYVNPSQASVRLATFANTFIAHDIRGYRHTQLFKKVPGVYIDQMEFSRFTVAASYDNSEYAVELGTGGGDCVVLENMEFPNNVSISAPELAIKMTSGQNQRISSIVNGNILLTNAVGASLEKLHMEYGWLSVTDSSVSVSDSKFAVPADETYYSIESLTTGSNVNYRLELRNVQFLWGGTNWQAATLADIKTAGQCALICTNVFRNINMASGHVAHTGIRVNNTSDVEIAAWTNNSWYLSMSGAMLGEVPSGSHPATITTDFNGLYNALNKTTGYGDSTLVNTTTYYYTAQLLVDAARSVGRDQSAGEKSVTMTADDQRVGGAMGWGTGTQAAIYRIYRGTTTGSYGYYVDIPSMRCLYFVDSGDYCNGIPWVDRGGASAVATITSTAAGTWIITPIGKVAVA